MVQQQRILIVLADGDSARFVRLADDNGLHTALILVSDAAHKRSSDLGRDHPGAVMHTGSTAHHGLTPRHDRRRLEQEKFAHLVADRLNTAALRGDFDGLVIVAAPRTLHSLCPALETAVERKIIGALTRNLVKTPDDALWPHLRAWLRPVRRSIPLGLG